MTHVIVPRMLVARSPRKALPRAPWWSRPTLAIAAAIAGAAPRADADPKVPAHAIGGIEITGSAHASLGPALRQNAEDGLTGATLHVAADASRKLLGAVPELESCIKPDCLARFATAIGAERVVAIRVESNGELYNLRVEVTDASGRAVRRRQDACVACAVPDLQDKVTALVRTAVAPGEDDTVEVHIAAHTSDAALMVDEVARGRGTWRGKLVAGLHRVVVTEVDGRSATKSIFVAVDGDHRFDVAVPALHTPVRTWGSWRWAAAATSGVAIVAGVVLLAKDGDGSCGEEACPENYELTLPGVISLGTGVAIGAAAGWMFWRDSRAKRPAIALVPTADGVTAGVTGRF